MIYTKINLGETMIKKLKKFIKEKNLSQKDAALILGINRWTLNRWLRGKSKMSLMAKSTIERKIK